MRHLIYPPSYHAKLYFISKLPAQFSQICTIPQCKHRKVNASVDSMSKKIRDKMHSLDDMQRRVDKLQLSAKGKKKYDNVDIEIDDELSNPVKPWFGEKNGENAHTVPGLGKFTNARVGQVANVNNESQTEMKNERGDQKINEAPKNLTKREKDMLELEVCPVCARAYPPARISRHVKLCEQKNQFRTKNRENRRVDGAPTLGVLKPRPPTNFSLVNVGWSSLEFSWTEPIVDGGSLIFDYEVVVALSCV